MFERLACAELGAAAALVLALHKTVSFSLAQMSLWEQQQLQLMDV